VSSAESGLENGIGKFMTSKNLKLGFFDLPVATLVNGKPSLPENAG